MRTFFTGIIGLGIAVGGFYAIATADTNHGSATPNELRGLGIALLVIGAIILYGTWRSIEK